jgi:uncharacterized membrane protein (UPF0127 family)
MMIKRNSDQALIVSQGQVANTYWSRLCGLVGTKHFEAGSGLLFPKCNSIHMWMMSIPIDVVFLKLLSPNQYQIVGTHSNLRPWKFLPVFCLEANDTLELPQGTIQRHHLNRGETLCIV